MDCIIFTFSLKKKHVTLPRTVNYPENQPIWTISRGWSVKRLVRPSVLGFLGHPNPAWCLTISPGNQEMPLTQAQNLLVNKLRLLPVLGAKCVKTPPKRSEVGALGNTFWYILTFCECHGSIPNPEEHVPSKHANGGHRPKSHQPRRMCGSVICHTSMRSIINGSCKAPTSSILPGLLMLKFLFAFFAFFALILQIHEIYSGQD